MHPIIFKFGPLTIHSYGLLVAIGFAAAALLASRQATAINIPPDKIINLSLIILVYGIIGGRACFVLLNIRDYLANPIEIIMLNHGGLVFYGGALFAFLAGLVYVKKARLPLADTFDLLSPYVALGHSIGRIGCLLNGCCFGRPANSPFGVVFKEGIVRVPTQLYSSLFLLALFVFLKKCLGHRRFRGEVFFLYLIFYSAGRFVIEGMRGDNPALFFNLTFSQAVSSAIFIIGVAGYIWGRIRLQ